MPSARASQASFGASNSLVYMAGGYNGTSTVSTVSKYDGTNWSSETALPTASDNCLGINGDSPSFGFVIRGTSASAATFLFTGAGVATTKTITTS